jgi:LysM repeat protein
VVWLTVIKKEKEKGSKMAAPLIVAAAGTIIRYIAKNGLKKAVERYGKKAVDNARKTKGTKGEKSVENFREAKGKAHRAAKDSPKSSVEKKLPSANRKTTEPAAAKPKKPPAVRSNASKEVGKAKPKEGEYIPKDKPMSKAKKKSGGATVEGKAKRPMSNGKKAAVAAAGAAAGATMLASSSKKETKNKSTPSSKGYTIKKGDTLSAIAEREGIRLSELKAANKGIKDLNKIRVGQKITVPKASIKGTGKSIYEGMPKKKKPIRPVDKGITRLPATEARKKPVAAKKGAPVQEGPTRKPVRGEDPLGNAVRDRYGSIVRDSSGKPVRSGATNDRDEFGFKRGGYVTKKKKK